MALGLQVGVASAEPTTTASFPDRDPSWWIELGGGYGRSIPTGDDPVDAEANLPVAVYAMHLALTSRLSLVGELDIPVPLATDGGFNAGVGLALTIPLSAPRVIRAGEPSEPRRYRSRFELVLRGTGGWGAMYNDLSEGYISTSEDTFEASGLYVRGAAGVRWRLDNDRGRLKSIGLGLFPTVTALRADYSRPMEMSDSWRIHIGASVFASLGF